MASAAKPIAGTHIFDGAAAQKGYALNAMCFSFNHARNRDEFVRDEDAYCDRFGLTDEQRAAVKARSVLQMIAAGFRDSGRGRIVLIGSITAELTAQGDAAYAASKAGVAHLGRQFAREWVRQGINVNTIQPGYIQTEIAGDWFQTEGGQRQIAAFHRKRMCPIEALDAPLLFLCSDASLHVTGATLTVDDGQVL